MTTTPAELPSSFEKKWEELNIFSIAQKDLEKFSLSEKITIIEFMRGLSQTFYSLGAQEALQRVEEVIGEDEDMVMATIGARKIGRPSRERIRKEKLISEKKLFSINAQERNDLRAAQRTKLAKLREEYE